MEGLIGFFVNTLVMRSDLSGNPGFRQLLGRVQETALDAYAHQDLPFEKLVEELKPERNLSRSPIIQVMFSLLNAPQQPLELSGVEVRRMEVENGTSKFDLSLYAVETAKGLRCALEYNTDLFDADRMERMAGHWEMLLEGIVAHPEQSVHELPLLTPREREQLLVEWNQTRADFPRDKCIHELVEEQVEQQANRVAVTGPTLAKKRASSVALTYTDLDRRANALACYLRSLGVGPEVLVAVCVERTVEWVVSLLAVLKAGGAYVPLDPAYPPARLRFILEETQVSVVLTQRALAAILPSGEWRVVSLDDPHVRGELHEKEGEAFPGSGSSEDPAQLAYVLYTSGTTGRPKGIEISHRSVVNFLYSMRAEPGLTAQDTLLSVTTPSFDIFGLEVWLPLTTGAQVVMASEEQARDGRELSTLIRRSGATVMQATPSMWRLLLESGWKGKGDLKILCGGEAWPAELAEQLLPRCESLWNMYGPTETTIWSSANRIEKGKPILMGRPIANTCFFVVDSHRQPVPVGLAGELLIGGEGVARGYWRHRELTAEKFIADPFGGESRLYRTGDLVRYQANGMLEFLGRMDQQVKIRGFRIELQEIENALREHTGVSEAVVTIREDERIPRIVAYVIPSQGPASGPDVLRNHLNAMLPGYMVPATFVMLKSLPLTPNGKIARNKLPPPPPSKAERRSDSARPFDSIELQLAQLWRKVLGVHHVGLGDDFFELGGSSIAAAQLFYEIERLTGKRLPLATLFRAPTVGKLAQILRYSGWTPDWSSLMPINAGGSQLPFFLIHGAEGNVLLYRQLARCLGPDQPVYGFQSQGLNGTETVASSIEEMASHYVKELLAVQPTGPFLLGGYCMGGTVAFEMAQQLLARGERVGLVAMLETYNLIEALRSNTPTPRLFHWLQNVWFHGANFCLAGDRDRWNFVREKWKVERARLGIKSRAVFSALSSSRKPGLDQSYPHLRVKLANDRAASQYQPQPYSGRVVVVRPKKGFWRLDDPTLGWSEVVRSGLVIREMSIYPRGMLVEPFVQMLAQELKVCLAEATRPLARQSPA